MAKLRNGPLLKNIHTQQLELIAKIAIHAPDAVRYKLKNPNTDEAKAYIIIGDYRVNIHKLLNKADLNHILMSQTDSDQLMKTEKFDFEYNGISQSELDHSVLTQAEMWYIKDYTQSGSGLTNHFLNHGASHLYNYDNQSSEQLLKRSLLAPVLVSSGLNKMMPSVEYQDYSYRGEMHAHEADLDARIESIEAGHGITKQKQFMSTSIDHDVSAGFVGNSLIVFEGTYGKNIMDLSLYPSEQEFLIAPTMIQWTNHVMQDDVHVFTAKVVNPLISKHERASEKDYQQFDKLLTIAKENGINTDFITPDLKAALSSRGLNKALNLSDVVSMEIDSIPGLDGDAGHQAIPVPPPPPNWYHYHAHHAVPEHTTIEA